MGCGYVLVVSVCKKILNVALACVVALAVLFKTKMHPVCVIIAGGIFGVLFL